MYICVILPPIDLNSGSCPVQSTNTYICGVTIAQRVPLYINCASHTYILVIKYIYCYCPSTQFTYVYYGAYLAVVTHQCVFSFLGKFGFLKLRCVIDKLFNPRKKVRTYYTKLSFLRNLGEMLSRLIKMRASHYKDVLCLFMLRGDTFLSSYCNL